MILIDNYNGYIVLNSIKIMFREDFKLNILGAIDSFWWIQIERVVLWLKGYRQHFLSVIFYAAKTGFEVDIRSLLYLNVDVLIRDNECKNIFHYACDVTRIDQVKFILEEKQLDQLEKVDCDNKDRLYFADSSGSTETVKLLVESGKFDIGMMEIQNYLLSFQIWRVYD